MDVLEEHEVNALQFSDPPYLEIKTRAEDTRDTAAASLSASTGGRGCGLISQLGAEYERKKQRLQEELRQDFRCYVTKKEVVKGGEPGPQPRSLSLPIDERRFAKEQLREERNTEYNLFLKRQAGLRHLRQTSPVVSQVQVLDAPSSSSPIPLLRITEVQPTTANTLQPTHEEQLPFTRDAITQTKAAGPGTGTQNPQRRRQWQIHRLNNAQEAWEGKPRRLRGLRVDHSSEDEEEELELNHQRARNVSVREPGHTVRAQRHRADRVLPDTKEVDVPGVCEKDNGDRIRKSQSARTNPIAQMPDSMRTTERSRSAANKDTAEFSTGLLIGATERNSASQMRKERYRLELLEQMAEGQRNKRKEKELELRVAATGAVDPEKKPDRIKQFGAVNREYTGWRRDVPYKPGVGMDAWGTTARTQDDKPPVGSGPPDKPPVTFPSSALDYSTALGHNTGRTAAGLGMGVGLGVPGLSSFNEDLHRSLSNTLGEMVAPRVATIPPPRPPTLTDAYRTPYDEAYYYYGARNPLDPYLPYRGTPVGGVAAPHRPNDSTGATIHHEAASLSNGVLLPGEKKATHTRDKAQTYQEELRQQIKDSEERRRRDRQERERYDAKIEAEMKAYDPWGRGGGGAPIRDHRGNLISDLKQMHRINETAYMNPQSRDRREPDGPAARNVHTPRVEDRAPSYQTSGRPSQFARGNVFTAQPTPQHLHEQDTYKDFLKQQIEEKRRKQAEERERIQAEEEREDRRLAEDRARMLREYEAEQENRKKKMEHKQINKTMMRQADEHREEEEKRVMREEEKRQKEALRLQSENEERRERLAQQPQREPSPPVPALQKKHQASRPPSAISQLSSRPMSVQSTSSVPPSPPVPARRNQLRAKEDQRGVLGELSTLRKHLRSEHRRLEGQLGQTDGEETDTPLPTGRRGRPKVDMFELARMRAAQGATRMAHSGHAHVNTQNLREFNQLKYRDTESREEVRYAYPEPPSDEHSLDIQQQALLREQQRRIKNMRTDDGEIFRQQQKHLGPRNTHAAACQRESESVFIDYYKDDACLNPTHKQRSPQHSAEDRERHIPLKKTEHPEEVIRPSAEREYEIQPDAQSLGSVSSLNVERVRAHNQHRLRRLNLFDKNHDVTSDGVLGDDEDILSLRSIRSALERRVSVETVATEPWLRTGTPEVARRPGRRERPASRETPDQHWDRPTTYHG